MEDGEVALTGEASMFGEGIDSLRLTGERSAGLVLPGPFGAEAFNQVAVTLISDRAQQGVRLEIRRGDQSHRTPARMMAQSPDPVTLVFDIETPRWQDLAVDELLVEFLAEAVDVQVASVDLIRRPWRDVLGVGGSGALVIDGVARNATLLSSLTPLACAMDCEPDMQLEFSYCRPPALMRLNEQPALHVHVQGADGTSVSKVLTADQETDGPLVWYRASLAIAGLKGPKLNVTFEVSTGEEQSKESLFAVSELALTRRTSKAATVMLVTSDTHRADHVGVAGKGVEIRTPFLDGFATRGVYFEDCISASNVTRSSHASILTAITPRDTGVHTNHDTLSQDAWTLAETFREAGYVTYAAVSAGHLGRNNSGMRQGFDRVSWPVKNPRGSEGTTQQLLTWLPDAEDLPLFIWLHLFDAHTPYEPGEPYNQMYYPATKDPRDPALPELSPAALGNHNPEHPWLRGVRDTDYLDSLYKGEVTRLDDSLGRLFQAPRLTDAIVAITADHGESLTAHGIYYNHSDLYPDSLRVPLILSWPGAPAGTRIERPVQNTDVGRTLLDLAGLSGAEFPGSNLLAGATGSPRFAISSARFSAAILDEGHLLILHLRKHRASWRNYKSHEVELYDLALDPGCETNLSVERRALASELRQRLVDWLVAEPTVSWRSSGDLQQLQELKDLAALGYASEANQPEAVDWIDLNCECSRCREFR